MIKLPLPTGKSEHGLLIDNIFNLIIILYRLSNIFLIIVIDINLNNTVYSHSVVSPIEYYRSTNFDSLTPLLYFHNVMFTNNKISIYFNDIDK